MFILPWSAALESELRALPPEKKAGLKARRHPSARALAVFTARSLPAEQLVRELVRRYGEASWQSGRWRIRRPQLRLPGI